MQHFEMKSASLSPALASSNIVAVAVLQAINRWLEGVQKKIAATPNRRAAICDALLFLDSEF
jgi:hypothetical protein